MLNEPIVVRVAGPADAAALLRLHHEGFASDWTPAQWRWRFLDNPLGRTEISAAFTKDGRCVASFCGVPLPCRYGNELALAQRAGDVIVHPALRAGMAGSQLLLRTAEHFFGTFGGGDTRIVFGFPEPGLSRTIVRHCRFEAMADILLLTRPVDGKAASTAGAWSSHCGNAVPHDIDALASAWPATAAGIVRDARYLRWRYEGNPHTAYVFVTVRDGGGRLRGVTVVRQSGLFPGSAMLMEWLLADGDEQASLHLLAAADALAQTAGRTTLVASCSTTAPEFAWLQSVGCRVVPTLYQFVYRCWGPGLDRRALRERWRHSLGDMDFT